MMLFSSSSVFAEKVDSKNPYNLIEGVADITFARLKKNNIAYKNNPELLRNVVREDVLPYVNVRYAALKVLGPLAKKTTKEEPIKILTRITLKRIKCLFMNSNYDENGQTPQICERIILYFKKGPDCQDYLICPTYDGNYTCIT